MPLAAEDEALSVILNACVTVAGPVQDELAQLMPVGIEFTRVTTPLNPLTGVTTTLKVA